ncbi:hypothetical protein IB277_31160 [Ensifer sp. ENS07]|uniref:hypothetical protein n=1 Tax=Ensifer sp. ENS07 TaxID=2769274 RepID=UPI00178392F6|nr:hypothetical protein [Ensifer sp. ENS07]MBD9640759.1 hypothetical protein [Ensifer sp. ENS07]
MNIINFPTRRARLSAITREAIENEIERLIELLDMVDGDENLEPELAGFDERCMDDREGDDEREDDPAEIGIADLGGLAEQAPFFGFCFEHVL